MNIIEFGDCRETMRRWASEGIKAQTCVTSPPYFGLRDYGRDGQIGMEETPDEYIAQMVEVFRCVRDVLADDGTVWLNIGDSYCNSNGFARASPEYQREGRNNMPANDRKLDKLHATGLKTKDLIGIPWMLAFALRADGWYLRQDIIWSKPNPMPESVQDRCTKSHEYIFLLSKSQKYYFDGEGIQEQSVGGSKGAAASFKRTNSKRGIADVCPASPMPTHREDREDVFYDGPTRNRRSVWTIPVKPYGGAHFAVFPNELIEPCIMAGAPVGGIVLDPFMGSGTTAQVAQNLGRQYLGCELNEDYKPLQDERMAQQALAI
jgi:DNA modification methylase